MDSSPVTRLRNLMKQEKLSGYIIPTGDAHQSEYIREVDARRAYISSFTGSMGLALVGQEDSWLWTDGRYYNQASKELPEGWTLMKVGLPQTPTIQDFISQNFPSDAVIGADPRLLSNSTVKDYQDAFSKKGVQLKLSTSNLVDQIWTDKPVAQSERDIHVMPDAVAGRSMEDKLTWLRGILSENEANLHVLSALDAICWLLNIRGSDIPYNPVVVSYVIVTQDACLLFIDATKVTKELSQHLEGKVTVHDYDTFFTTLEALASGRNIWLDPESSNAIFSTCKGAKTTISKASPVTLEKALKNKTELDGMRACGLRDAVALVNYFSWLENELNTTSNVHDEVTASDKLLEFRKEQSGFITPSFATISSVGPNAAIIHYHPHAPTAAKIVKEKIYLCDSGGQYTDGTTDVTRTFHFGQPTQKERDAYTCVLKGVIALTKVVFPTNTTGLQLDALARQSLWALGLDYRHGTGHGVGHFLNVHEGPHGISFRIGSHSSPLQAGMTVTNEPGYYEDGHFGIRIENQLIVTNVKTQFNFNQTQFLGFETTTFVPLDKNLINLELLTPEEIQWVNQYHQQCTEKVLPLITNQLAIDWFKQRTAPISK